MSVSLWMIPVIILLITAYGHFKGVKIYDCFTDGAQNGLKIVFEIIPFLLAMMVAINIFKTSGAMDLFIDIFSSVLNKLNVPEPVIPLLFLRPLSGSGSLSYVNRLIQEYGPDSFIGNLASTIQGSTETTFYIVTLYFGAVGIKKYRYAVIVGIIADIAGFFAAVFICNLLFL